MQSPTIQQVLNFIVCDPQPHVHAPIHPLTSIEKYGDVGTATCLGSCLIIEN